MKKIKLLTRKIFVLLTISVLFMASTTSTVYAAYSNNPSGLTYPDVETLSDGTDADKDTVYTNHSSSGDYDSDFRISSSADDEFEGDTSPKTIDAIFQKYDISIDGPGISYDGPVTSAIKGLGWVVIKLACVILDALDSLIDAVLDILSVLRLDTYFTWLKEGWIAVILTISIFLMGMFLIISQKKPPILRNILLMLVVLSLFPALFLGSKNEDGTTNESALSSMMKGFKDVTYSSDDSLIKNNTYSGITASTAIIRSEIYDFDYIARQGWSLGVTNSKMVANGSLNNIKTYKEIDITEAFNEDNVDSGYWKNEKSADAYYTLCNIKRTTSTNKDGSTLSMYTESGGYLFGFGTSTPYRYQYSWISVLITLLAFIYMYLGASLKLVKLEMEIITGSVIAILASPDLASGEKTKQAVQGVVDAFLSMAMVFILLKIFVQVQSGISAMSVGFLTRAILKLLVAVALAQGPQIVGRIFGYNAGFNEGQGGLLRKAGSLGAGLATKAKRATFGKVNWDDKDPETGKHSRTRTNPLTGTQTTKDAQGNKLKTGNSGAVTATNKNEKGAVKYQGAAGGSLSKDSDQSIADNEGNIATIQGNTTKGSATGKVTSTDYAAVKNKGSEGGHKAVPSNVTTQTPSGGMIANDENGNGLQVSAAGTVSAKDSDGSTSKKWATGAASYTDSMGGSASRSSAGTVTATDTNGNVSKEFASGASTFTQGNNAQGVGGGSQITTAAGVTTTRDGSGYREVSDPVNNAYTSPSTGSTPYYTSSEAKPKIKDIQSQADGDAIKDIVLAQDPAVSSRVSRNQANYSPQTTVQTQDSPTVVQQNSSPTVVQQNSSPTVVQQNSSPTVVQQNNSPTVQQAESQTIVQSVVDGGHSGHSSHGGYTEAPNVSADVRHETQSNSFNSGSRRHHGGHSPRANNKNDYAENATRRDAEKIVKDLKEKVEKSEREK